MREHPTETNQDTDAWSLNGDLFYRKEDKKPFLGAVKAVEQQEKSLIVIGDEGVLDHYCRMLISRIKDNEQFHLEVFLSTSKDGLLKRFNQMLANLSIDEARKPASADTSVHLLVINDASAVKDEEWTLLIRLIRDFPGANVRVALFVDKSSITEFENRFEKLGRRVHRWTVHAPTLDEVKKLKEIGKLKGYASEVNKMLLIAGLKTEGNDKPEPVVTEEVVTESLIVQPTINIDDEPAEEVISAAPSDATKVPHAVPEESGQSYLRRALLLFCAFASSLLLLSRQQPTIIDDWTNYWVGAFESHTVEEVSSKSDQELDPMTSSAVAEKPEFYNTLESIQIVPSLTEGIVSIRLGFSNPVPFDPEVTLSEGNEKLTLLFRETDVEPLQDKEREVNMLGMQKIEILQNQGETSLNVFQKAMTSYSLTRIDGSVNLSLSYPAVGDREFFSDNQEIRDEEEQIAEVSVTNIDEDAIEEVPEEPMIAQEVIVDSAFERPNPVDIILGSDDSEFFIQHIVFSERSQAEDFVLGYPGLETAQIVPIISGENRFLAVISGPFESRGRATLWAKEFDLPADFWIRSAALLKRVVATNE